MRIDVYGLFNGYGGWSTHGRNVVRSLAPHHDLRVIAWDGPPWDAGLPPLAAPLGAPDPGADIALCIGPMDRVDEALGRARIGFYVWETTVIPARHMQALAGFDEVWVPSAWGRDMLIANGLDPARIAVVPEGVDADLFHPGPARTGRFRFLFVGKWEARKGVDDLLHAWAAAFPPGAEAELVLHAFNPYLPGFSIQGAVDGLGLPPSAPIRPSGPCSVADMAALYRDCDAFVLPTRAEGWGLPILEAMASGLPAIVTAYSAPTDFLTHDCAVPLAPAGLVPVHDPLFYGGGADHGLWAAPDRAALGAAMVRLARDRGAARALGLRARAAVEARWTWRHAGAIALRRLAQLGG